MTAYELAERLDSAELGLWLVEDYLREDARKDVALEAKAKANLRKALG